MNDEKVIDLGKELKKEERRKKFEAEQLRLGDDQPEARTGRIVGKHSRRNGGF